ncbi:MAG: alkane 1-monooxygenase [Bacteroidia bacterium]|nr:alkane 1-monooxygenase [Bacteroidia bacterium]MCX7652083.1 alkane 1-monooxygenase [Bacteroidia bacterium]MDW8417110.1 alkane 1-monooxygenase [Bacteroidia bacterium]
MHRNLQYLNSLLLPMMAYIAISRGGWWGLMPWLVVFGIVALIELFLPEHTDNQYDEDESLPAGILIGHFVAHVGLLIYWASLFARGKYSPWEALVSALAVGFNAGASGIVIAHEMLHRKGSWWQAGAKILLGLAGNLYFYVTHIRMHHRYVGTDLDYSSAKRGESLYHFLWRTIKGQLRWAWQAERMRLGRLGASPFGLSNYILQEGLILIVALLAFTIVGGLVGFLAFCLQALVANFLLEYVNYIEHYGLARKPEEPIRPWHSWESNKYFSRFFLVDLSRHSDHHLHGAKPYHTLRSIERAPRLPTGYAGMLYLALLPWLWRKIVDPRIPSSGLTSGYQNP